MHLKYLDVRGLVALWREGLLAQAVLRGRTIGYKHHPQLLRFQALRSPIGGIAGYLRVVHAEATARGYHFDDSKLSRARHTGRLVVTRGQLDHEWAHLMAKVARRDPSWRARIGDVGRPAPHPVFRAVAGGVEAWERAT